MRRKIRSSVHKLTRRVARAFTGLTDRDGPEAYLPSTPGSQHTCDSNLGTIRADPVLSIMADGEEDYSSLPLTDRWVHKVRGTSDSTIFRLHRYNKTRARQKGGGPRGNSRGGHKSNKAYANHTLPGCRSGKFEKEHMRKPSSSSKSAPTSTMLPFSHSCETLPYGKVPSPTAMWQPNKTA
jgi:hypothetical protein